MEYTILMTRAGGRCMASIPELCIAEKGSDPQEALAAALRAEAETRKAMGDAGKSLPPAGGRLDPLPGLTRAAGGYLAFFRDVLLGYVLVALITAVLVAIALPSARARAEEYLSGKEIAADAGRILARLGVAVCSEKR